MVKQRIVDFIDFFYPPFRRFMPEQTFRYAVCGGTTTFLDIFIYAISYNFILKQHSIFIGRQEITAYVASFLMSFAVSFPTGFFLNRNIVFTGSTLHGRVQLFRYFVLVVICLLLNYVFIKLFVERCHFYPTVAKIFTTIIVVSFSYLTQKNFTFRIETKEAEEEMAEQQPSRQPEIID